MGSKKALPKGTISEEEGAALVDGSAVKGLPGLDPPQDRIRKIHEQHWVPYPFANMLFGKMGDLMRRPKTNRTEGLLLYGPTTSGKTELLLRFVEKHPASERPDGGGLVIPALYVVHPPQPSEARLYSAILRAAGCPISPSATAERGLHQVLQTLPKLGVRILIIDEIHNLLAGSTDKHRKALYSIKNLFNLLGIPMVLAGTDRARNAVQAAPEVDSRLLKIAMPKWAIGDHAVFARLLAGFNQHLHLGHPLDLKDPDLATAILDLTGGQLGRIWYLLRDAAIHAIERQYERIDVRVLNAVSKHQAAEN